MTMRRTKVVGFVGVLASVAIIVVGAEKDGLGNWRRAVSTNDFKKTLANVKSLQEDWPAVHSVKHKVNKDGEKALVQTGYRDVSRTFLKGLEDYEKVFREMPPEAFCEGADALLDVRSRFLKHPSYINYFLIDSINRVICINLGERLVKAGNLPVCYDRIVERLAEFSCDWTQLYELASRECETNPISRAEIEKLSTETKIEAIEEMAGQKNFVFMVQDAHNLYGLRILDKRSLTALLARLVSSDYYMRASLPGLLSYRRKAINFAPTDSGDQIRAALGNESRLPETLWDPHSYTTRAVSYFLREVQSEQWRMVMGFSDPFSKEFVERQEKEEAEREAKREAEQK